MKLNYEDKVRIYELRKQGQWCQVSSCI